jgi:hypothetical protein
MIFRTGFKTPRQCLCRRSHEVIRFDLAGGYNIESILSGNGKRCRRAIEDIFQDYKTQE